MSKNESVWCLCIELPVWWTKCMHWTLTLYSVMAVLELKRKMWERVYCTWSNLRSMCLLLVCQFRKCVWIFDEGGIFHWSCLYWRMNSIKEVWNLLSSFNENVVNEVLRLFSLFSVFLYFEGMCMHVLVVVISECRSRQTLAVVCAF